MEFAIYAALALALIAVVIGTLILQKVGRPPTIPDELSTRIAVLEQVAKALPETKRDEARAGPGGTARHVRSCHPPAWSQALAVAAD